MDLFTFVLIVTIIAVILSIVFAFNVYESGVIAGRYNMSRTTNRHRKCVNIFLCDIAMSVMLVESMLSLKRGTAFEIRLFETGLGIVHVILIGIFLISVVTMRWFVTGEDNKELHRKISKVVLSSYALILITGTWLIVRLLNLI